MPTADRAQVRRRTSPLLAVQATSAQTIELPDGSKHAVQKGDWLISRGQTLVDWARMFALDERYEYVQSGELKIPVHLAKEIERSVGIGATRDAATLVKAIERVAAIEIGRVRIDFTPGQLEELKARAVKRGRTVQQELEAVVSRIKDELFWNG